MRARACRAGYPGSRATHSWPEASLPTTAGAGAPQGAALRESGRRAEAGRVGASKRHARGRGVPRWPAGGEERPGGAARRDRAGSWRKDGG